MTVILLASCATTAQTGLTVNEEVKSKALISLGDGGVSDFYSIEPERVPSEPGVFIQQEPLQPHQSVLGVSRAVRVLYTSTDGLDSESIVTVSGSLLLPEGEMPEDGWPMTLWSHGTVGIADVCAPSWTGYVPFHQEYLKQWLDQGYAIITSDYQGLGTAGTHPYLAIRPAAYSNLDLIRAVRSLDYNLSEKMVVVGQSQGAGVGAGAAIATAAYAPDYSPEIELLGVVATGVPFFSPEALIAVQQARPQDKVDLC